VTDPTTDFEARKDRCFRLAAEAYSGNQLDLNRYEILAGEIAAANDITSLQVIESSLPQPQHRSAETQVIRADMGEVHKVGKWIESSHVLVEGQMAKVTLDFMDYAAEADLRVDLVLDCRMSQVRIIVPRGIDVLERMTSNSMSTFRDRRRSDNSNSAIVVTGDLTMSKVKVRRKKVRRSR